MYNSTVRGELTFWQCNATCVNRQNKTDIKELNPKCVECKHTRCGGCTIKAISPTSETDVPLSALCSRLRLPSSRGPSIILYYCVQFPTPFNNMLWANPVVQCQCGAGPQSLRMNPFCVACGDRFCGYCKQVSAQPTKDHVGTSMKNCVFDDSV